MEQYSGGAWTPVAVKRGQVQQLACNDRLIIAIDEEVFISWQLMQRKRAAG